MTLFFNRLLFILRWPLVLMAAVWMLVIFMFGAFLLADVTVVTETWWYDDNGFGMNFQKHLFGWPRPQRDD